MRFHLLEKLVPQVKRNCDISDARYWGFYSICGLLLRLRELYRFEHGIRPWDRSSGDGIPDWIGRREALWEEVAGEEFSPLRIDGEEFGPFEVGRINVQLKAPGLLYGAGYGLFGKPVFFLSELSGHEVIDGYDVFVSGDEYARDLSIHPAMLQGQSIFARQEISALLVWEKFEELKAKKTASSLSAAFSSYGIEAAMDGAGLRDLIKDAADSELRSYIHHELGEAFESEKTGPLWTGVLSSVLMSRASLFARAVKDTLADASERGMLRHIIDERKTGSLAFYATSLGGYRRSLATEMATAFGKFTETGSWGDIESARQAVYAKAARIAENIFGIYRGSKDPEALAAGIQRQLTLLQP